MIVGLKVRPVGQSSFAKVTNGCGFRAKKLRSNTASG